MRLSIVFYSSSVLGLIVCVWWGWRICGKSCPLLPRSQYLWNPLLVKLWQWILVDGLSSSDQTRMYPICISCKLPICQSIKPQLFFLVSEIRTIAKNKICKGIINNTCKLMDYRAFEIILSSNIGIIKVNKNFLRWLTSPWKSFQITENFFIMKDWHAE